MSTDTAFLRRCMFSLEVAVTDVGSLGDVDGGLRDVHRDACSERDRFERALKQTGKLLRKRFADYFVCNRHVDRSAFRDLFRHAAKHGLIEVDAAEGWLDDRDNRYGPPRFS